MAREPRRGDMVLPEIRVPADMASEEMPDLLRYWYLGTRSRRHMALRRFAEVDRELDGTLGGPVLDIGSAWGYNVMALSSNGLVAVGVDLVVDQFAVGGRIARENGLGFLVAGADAAALPFPDATFRSITMVETFEHVFQADRERVLRECHRVLAAGGRIVLSTPNHGGLVERFKRVVVRYPALQRRLPTMCYPAGDVGREAYHPYRYHRPASAREIAQALERAGFKVSRIKYFLFAMKNTPDPFFPLVAGAERLLERTPGLRRLAATVCVVADR